MRKFLGLFIFTLLSTSLAFAGQTKEVDHNKVVKSTTSSSQTSGNSHYTFTCKIASKVDQDLKCGVMIKDDNYRGENNFSDYGDCGKKGWPSMGRELVYRFVNHKARDLTFTLVEDNGNQPKLLNMFIVKKRGDGGCAPTECLGSVVRPAAHYDSDRNTVVLKNAAAGEYYVIVDGNRVTGHNWFKLTVDCEAGDYTTCNNPYYYDDFEMDGVDYDSDPKTDDDRPRPDVDYHVGDYITKVNSYWSNNGNVGIRDARITDTKSSNGMNSLEFNRAAEGTQEAVLDLGRKFKGAYRLCFSMFIEKNHTAFFGIFGGDNSDPWGSISKEFGMNSVYQGKWLDVELFVDLDRNDYVLYLDNRCVSFTGAYNLNLDALMFYGLPNAHFYVDAICFGAVDGKKIPRPSSRVASTLGDTPLFTADQQALQLAGSVQAITDNGLTQTAVSTSLNATDLKVVPNPTSGATTIALDLDQAQNIELQIFSSTGQIVRQVSLGQTSIVRHDVNLGDLANGLYILKATGENTVITKKIVLQK
jgi:hypothetical protein